MIKIDKRNNLYLDNKKVGQIKYNYPYWEIMVNGRLYEKSFSITKARKMAKILLNDFAFVEKILAA